MTSPSNRLSRPSSICLVLCMGSLLGFGVNYYFLDSSMINTILAFGVLIGGISLGITLGLIDFKIYKKESWRIVK